MEATYRFVKNKGGLTSFAEISLRAMPGNEFKVRWPDELHYARNMYGDAVEKGIRLAYDAHSAIEHTPMLIEVTGIVDVPSDTKPDAVTCAAAMAMWKALGNDESSVVFELDREWRVSFSRPVE